MKPLWNAPSWGTLRARHWRCIVFLMVAIGPLSIVPYLLLAPAFPAIHAIRRKRPRFVWRTALVLSLSAAVLLISAWSPWYVGAEFPFALRVEKAAAFDVIEDVAWTLQPVLVWLNAGLTIELALLPLLAISMLHTIWTASPQTPPTTPKRGE